jgi:hypothetical protein
LLLVHEITHIIEGVNRHSEGGIMRAQWTDEDRKLMKTHPLPFAPDDVELIQRGLAPRSTSTAGTKMAMNPSSARSVLDI